MAELATHFEQRKMWRRESLATVTTKVTDLYERVLTNLGYTDRWGMFGREVNKEMDRDIISGSDLALNWQGFEFHFISPSRNLIPLIDGEKVIWHARDPRFFIYTDPEINPEIEDYLDGANDILTREAPSMGLEVVKDPFCLIFPGDNFASTKLYRVMLLDPEGE